MSKVTELVKLDGSTRRALEEVLLYMLATERKHYDSCSDEEKQRHIYRDVEQVRDWLSNAFGDGWTSGAE